LKKCGVTLALIFLIFSACSNPPVESNSGQNQTFQGSPSPNSNPSTGGENPSNGEGEIQEHHLGTSASPALSEQIQTLNLDLNQVRIIESSEVEWTDSCLGIEQPGIDCLPQVTPGYWVILESNGLEFEYHADKTGSTIHPATPAFTWTREGGDEEYCDKLIVYLPDSAHACWCQSGEMMSASINLLDILSEEEFETLIDSMRNYSENTLNQPSSGESETAMVTLTFYGQGNNFPQSEEQLSVLSFVEDIFTRITSTP